MKWYGIHFESDDTTASSMSCVEFSEALIGVNIIGDAPLSISNITVSNGNTGLRFDDRDDLSLIGGNPGTEIYDCRTGVDLFKSDIDISGNTSFSGVSIHDNWVGIKCTRSSPTIRDCSIYANDKGLETKDRYSIPDLGTTSDGGYINFYGFGGPYPGEANDIHIYAVEPLSDIYAQKNWWGTLDSLAIEARIVVTDEPYEGGTVIYLPTLKTGPGSQSLPGQEEQVLTLASPGLKQNYPNPFRAETGTIIHYGVAKPGRVEICIWDAAGRLVKVMEQEAMPGDNRTRWDGTDQSGRRVGSGVYFYQVKTQNFSARKRMLLLR
jgi:hypothetical protein